MKKIFSILALTILSTHALASHECSLELAHSEDLATTIATKTVSTNHGTIRSVDYGTILIEEQKITRRGKVKSQLNLDVHAVANGWDDQQETTFVIVRKGYKNGKRISWETVSDKFTLKGTEKRRAWFDEYKLEISCEAKNEN